VSGERDGSGARDLDGSRGLAPPDPSSRADEATVPDVCDFNLLPVVPLDGGRISAALHPAIWFGGFLALVALVIYRPNPLLIIILLFAATELRRRWKLRHHPQMQDYYRVKPAQRAIVGLLYFGLAAALVFGMHATQVPRHF
jgi:hypothetical protein